MKSVAAVTNIPSLWPGDTVGLVACSNPWPRDKEPMLNSLMQALNKIGLSVTRSPYIFEDEPHSPHNRAEAVMAMFCDASVQAVFDISGGDSTKEMLHLLEFSLLANHFKPFFGYSDVTTLLNTLYSATGLPSCLYQVSNLVRAHGAQQQLDFAETLLRGKDNLQRFRYEWLQGDELEGVVVGGNLRCLLKLEDTPYMPDFTDKLLFLEGQRGGERQIGELFSRLAATGALQKIRGLLLGTFSELDREKGPFAAGPIALEALQGRRVPVAVTPDIGHGSNSRSLMLGMDIRL